MKKIFIGILMLGSVAFMGCDNLMNQEPLGAITDAKYWKTENDVSSAVAGGYAILRGAFVAKDKSVKDQDYWALSRFVAWGDYRAMITGTASGTIIDQSVDCWLKNIPNGSIPYGRNSLYWDDFYKVTQHGTVALSKIGGLDNSIFADKEQGKRHYMGEAMFLRTWTYFYLVKNFGDVVFVREVPNDPASLSSHIPRTPAAEVLDSLVNDARRAIDLLSWNEEMAAPKAIRADKGAAYVMLAEMLLTRGSDTDDYRTANGIAGNDYDEAKTILTGTLSDGSTLFSHYALLDAEQFPAIAKGGSDEGIFELAFDYATNECYQYSWGQLYTSHYQRPYRDVARSDFWLGPDVVTTVFDGNDQDKRFKAWVDISQTVSSSNAAPRAALQKYRSYTVKDETYYYDDNLPVYRMGGALLMAAEACIRTNDMVGAVSYMDQVRQRAGLLPYTGATDESSMIKALGREYYKELYCEGQIIYHLIRLGQQAIDMYQSNMSIAKGQHLLPIHPDYFSVNRYMTQNQYWIGKGPF